MFKINPEKNRSWIAASVGVVDMCFATENGIFKILCSEEKKVNIIDKKNGFGHPFNGVKNAGGIQSCYCTGNVSNENGWRFHTME